MNVYDEVTYPSAVYQQTHPNRLSVLATLSGMKPAPLERCRVLELGCGDGYNLISMAYALPESEFIGIDLAPQTVARGNAVAAKLERRNVRLEARDVAEDCSALGKFDYIIAHGLYSWVPAHVRERVMNICRDNLNPQGVAYVSYNAYPGNHMRDLVRGMMRYHVSHFPNPTDKIGQARGLVKLLSESHDKTDAYMQILSRELERISKYTDAGFFHDDLSSINQPFYFHEFMAHAKRNGLQFLGEAEMEEKQERDYPAHVRDVLAQLGDGDVVDYEQYRDFLRCRAFRQTLLCHEGIALNRRLDARFMKSLFLSGEIRPSLQQPIDGAENFIGCKKAELETDRPLVKTALRRLGSIWPMPISFTDLLMETRAQLERTGDSAVDERELSSAMLGASIAGALELATHKPRMVVEPSERPIASALARLQLEFGSRVSTLLHRIVQIDDPLSRNLVSLLDGTRNNAKLRDELQSFLNAQSGTNAPVLSTVDVADVLARLGRLALLES